MGYGLPTLPKVPFELKPFKLNLTLKDIPGPEGVALGFADWEIVLMHSGHHLEKVLHSGQTDAQGHISLSETQQKEIAEIYATRPNDVWVGSPGDLRPLNMDFEQPDWTEDRKAVQSMAALDYSDLPHGGIGEGSSAADTQIIKNDHGRSAFAMWKEIKKI